MVRLAWQRVVIESALYVMWTKLRCVSRALHLLNKETFGDVFENVKKGEVAMAAAELRVQSDPSVGAYTELQ